MTTDTKPTETEVKEEQKEWAGHTANLESRPRPKTIRGVAIE